ncbi:NAD(P)-dependent dehydrogenase (short-subunit alcohol dehydrogenase family) [Neobacillus niacini]|uniref:SDR family NAD(P)-dependent oxidoreductase n=1 Tax=Neobacillus niacini TaxID=86668 RepID=UPI002865ABCA|nr:SDR family oxidoreductase [Neobacillus niacini]MDR7080230.1 NAD(P)-dependent dehydrogenase (short-subunit alcohol dehydrogenase family) [Neobacillus niacini]
MTKVAALEFAQYNIRVNSVHPGIINTPILGVSKVSDILEEATKAIPLKRIAQPEEVSNLVLYIASDESSYSTGTEYYRCWVNFIIH